MFIDDAKCTCFAFFPCFIEQIFLASGRFSNMVNRVKPVHASYRSRSPSMFQLSSILHSSNTSKIVLVALVTSMYRSGIGNDSSLGTWVQRDGGKCSFLTSTRSCFVLHRHPAMSFGGGDASDSP